MRNIPASGALGKGFIPLWREAAHKSSCRLCWEGVVCSSKLEMSLLQVNNAEKGNTEQEEIKIWGESNVRDVKEVFICCSVLSDFSLMTEQGIGWIPLWKHILIALTQDTSRIPNPAGPCLAVCLAGSQNSFINSTELFHSLLKLNFH